MLGERGYYNSINRMACSQHHMDKAISICLSACLVSRLFFCGVEGINYFVMVNHFHLLVSDPAEYAYSSYGQAVAGNV